MKRTESRQSARSQWRNRIILFASAELVATSALAALEVLPPSHAQSVFGGARRAITVAWRNRGDQPVDCSLHARIVQATSATAAPVFEAPWKTLRVLAGQTITETATFNFPEVRGETRFIVEWLDETNRVLGTSDVFVFPTNLLHELSIIARGSDALGVLDRQNELKPLLRKQNLDFVDLGETELHLFRGKLAIICPVANQEQAHQLAAPIRTIARKGVAVVWIVPPPNPRDKLQPSFYSVPADPVAIVVAQSELVADLPHDPRSQLNLLRLCRLAVRPEAFTLPESN